jgi:hypothetical protein
MKLKNSFLLIALVLIILTNISDKVFCANTKWDPFSSVLNETKGKVALCEVKVSFDIANNKGQDICLEFLKQLEVTKGAGSSINIVKDEFKYCIEFQNDGISGFIESGTYNYHNVITIDIEQKCQDNQLENIKNTIDSAINKIQKSGSIKYENKQVFEFIMAELPSLDIYQLNDNVIRLLKKHNSFNVNSIEINKGISTVAYTGREGFILNQGRKMDFNYAICKYSSGNYLVMGTPIIIKPY